MQIESIAAMPTTSLPKSSLSQTDFIQLFVTELSYQDPMQPLNNREFLAQLAQLSNLEQSRISSENSTALVVMNVHAQTLNLLDKAVQFSLGDNTEPINGHVIAVTFSSAGAALTVKDERGFMHQQVTLNQINLVRN